MKAGQGPAVSMGECGVVEQDRGGDQRAGKGPPARLICTGDETAAKSTVKGK